MPWLPGTPAKQKALKKPPKHGDESPSKLDKIGGFFRVRKKDPYDSQQDPFLDKPQSAKGQRPHAEEKGPPTDHRATQPYAVPAPPRLDPALFPVISADGRSIPSLTSGSTAPTLELDTVLAAGGKDHVIHATSDDPQPILTAPEALVGAKESDAKFSMPAAVQSWAESCKDSVKSMDDEFQPRYVKIGRIVTLMLLDKYDDDSQSDVSQDVSIARAIIDKITEKDKERIFSMKFQQSLDVPSIDFEDYPWTPEVAKSIPAIHRYVLCIANMDRPGLGSDQAEYDLESALLKDVNDYCAGDRESLPSRVATALLTATHSGCIVLWSRIMQSQFDVLALRICADIATPDDLRLLILLSQQANATTWARYDDVKKFCRELKACDEMNFELQATVQDIACSISSLSDYSVMIVLARVLSDVVNGMRVRDTRSVYYGPESDCWKVVCYYGEMSIPLNDFSRPHHTPKFC